MHRDPSIDVNVPSQLKSAKDFEMLKYCVLVIILAIQGNDEQCPQGKYGATCNETCSRYCYSSTDTKIHCDKLTGKCSGGCKAGWYGDQCNITCRNNCRVCNVQTGTCTECEVNYTGRNCETFIESGPNQGENQTSQETSSAQETSSTQETTSTQATASTPLVAILVPVFTIFIIIIIIIITAAVYIRRIHRRSIGCNCHSTKQQKRATSREEKTSMYEAPRRPDIPARRSEKETLMPETPGRPDTPAMNREKETPMSETTRTPDAPATRTPAHRHHRTDRDLLVASRKGNRETVKRIMAAGLADVNNRDTDGMTPVMAAAWGGHRVVVELLVSEGADVSLVDGVGDNLLHYACGGGDEETVKYVLLLNVADINKRGRWSTTPVMRAAYKGHREVVELLLGEGADVSLENDDGNNILHMACLGGHMETVKFVLSLALVNINARNNKRQTAADVARRKGHHQLVDFMVPRNA